MPFNKKDFKFWIEATREYLTATVRDSKDFWSYPHLTMAFTREGGGYRSITVAKRAAQHQDGFTQTARSKDLQLGKPLSESTPADLETLKTKIAKNHESLEQLTQMFEEPQKERDEMPFYLTKPGMMLIKTVGTLLGGASYWAPYFSTLMENMPGLIAKNEEQEELMLFISKEDYDRASTIINTRISAYQRRVDELEARVTPKQWIYGETDAEAWKPFQFGKRKAVARGTLNRGVPTDCRVSVDDGGLLNASSEGIFLEVICPAWDGSMDGRLTFWVKPQDLGKNVYEASLSQGLDVGRSSPFVLDTVVSLEDYQKIPTTEWFYHSFFPTAEQWDAEQSPAKLSIYRNYYQLDSDHFMIEWERD
jgi:hypothetical protein